MLKFPHYTQTDSMTCGPACLRIICAYYGKKYSLADLVQISHTTREGSSLLGLSNAAEKIGFRTAGVKMSFEKLVSEKPFPCIAHWNQSHYLVIYKIKNGKIYVSDPAYDLAVYTEEEFLKGWASENDTDDGIALLLEPTDSFYKKNSSIEEDNKVKKGFQFIYGYLYPNKKQIFRLLLSMIIGSVLQLVFPFLTQSIVDVGIHNKDIRFIYLVLFAQLMLFAGRTTIDIIRNYILIRLSNKINIALVSDFFAKLMRLPISFFDVKMTGDILQRINDHKRIESFLTTSSLSTLFSVFNLAIFSVVLGIYNVQILFLFFTGSIFYFLWVVFFLKKRADIDYKMFQQLSKNQSKEIELISGMQEIKLNNAEKQKLWIWERLQKSLFEITLKSNSVSQLQNSGAALINELKNIFITFLSADLVLQNKITLGIMLSISYIIGQLNIPILDLVNFIQRWQDAKLSMERIGEIHSKENEEAGAKNSPVPENEDIILKDLCFKYDQLQKTNTLDAITVNIPSNKITAIVGTSGSGKTTLMKVLLKFYAPSSGKIFIGNTDLLNVPHYSWRADCGVVMQDGYIFSDTIANNIAVGEDNVDIKKLQKAAHIANIDEFVNMLPLGFNTQIGMEGVNLSAGQKQRILIARSIYKNPHYLFFDEATSALDANNEKVIMNNLNEFFKGRTVIVIAHRLSTVKNADQILVINRGKIVETGNHKELTNLRGEYYELVKNQLELGN